MLNIRREPRLQDLIKFNHERQRFIMIDPRPSANAFEWKRYCVEESIRRGDQDSLNANETSRKRSEASSRAVGRIRETNPTHGIMTTGVSKNKLLELSKFTIYSKVRKNEGE